MKADGVTLTRVLQVLEEVAPLELAEDWDHVGLLLEPLRCRPIRRILLTIDLTNDVVREAIRSRTDLVVAYHPPIFDPLRALRASEPKERALLKTAQAGIAIYSPHTALDAVSGGVNDWLADGLGDGRRSPLTLSPSCADEGADVCQGQGRLVALKKPITVGTLLRRVKAHLKLSHLRFAGASRSRRVKTVALCAGAGASVLLGVKADVYLTGEMRHHDVLAAHEAGIEVILCEHSNSERGFLPVLAGRLRKEFKNCVHTAVSRADREPIRTV